MKKLNIALMITLMLVSGAALAERGSEKYNEVAHPESSSTHYNSDTQHFSTADIIDRNS